MATVITAPQPIVKTGRFKVYLAGAIDMGAAPNWQQDIIGALQAYDKLVIFNPRRAYFDESTLDEQINWELDAMETADKIVMWLPYDAKAPVSLFETGLYFRSGKLLLGVETGFYRRRNLELTAERYGVPMWSTLDQIIDQVVNAYPGNENT